MIFIMRLYLGLVIKMLLDYYDYYLRSTNTSMKFLDLFFFLDFVI
jgi:hypothetical protein